MPPGPRRGARDHLDSYRRPVEPRSCRGGRWWPSANNACAGRQCQHEGHARTRAPDSWPGRALKEGSRESSRPSLRLPGQRKTLEGYERELLEAGAPDPTPWLWSPTRRPQTMNSLPAPAAGCLAPSPVDVASAKQKAAERPLQPSEAAGVPSVPLGRELTVRVGRRQRWSDRPEQLVSRVVEESWTPAAGRRPRRTHCYFFTSSFSGPQPRASAPSSAPHITESATFLPSCS